MPNSPFPDPDTNETRAAALSDDDKTLVFSAEPDDGWSSLVNFDGNQEDLADYDNHVLAAAFLER